MRMGPQPGVRTRAPVVKGAEKRRDSSPAQTIEAGRDSEGPRTLALTPFVDGLTLMIMSAIDSVRKSAAVRAEEWCAPQRVLVQRGIVFRKCSRQVRRSSSGDAAVCQRTYRPKVPKESPVPQFKSGTVRRAVASDDDAMDLFFRCRKGRKYCIHSWLIPKYSSLHNLQTREATRSHSRKRHTEHKELAVEVDAGIVRLAN
jgi:hypothetical protein